MIIKFIENVLEKDKRHKFECLANGKNVGHFFDTFSKEEWKKDDFECVVNGEKVEWSFIPCDLDEVVFVNNIRWGYLAVVVVSAILSYAINKIMAPSIPDMSQQSELDNSKTYSWEGVKNIVGEGNVVPVVYGRHKIGGALIEAFIDGSAIGGIEDRKYLNALFAIGEGPIHRVIENTIKLNDQLISYYNEAEYWTRDGSNAQEPINNFSKVVRHYSYSPVKPIVYGVDNGQIHRTQNQSNILRITITTPAIYRMDDNGDLQEQSVNLDIYYSAESATPSWTKISSITISGKTKSDIEYDAIIEAPIVDAPFLIKIVRTTEDFETDPKVACDTYLKSVSEIQNAILSYPGTALYGLRLKATDRLSGAMPTFTAEVIGRKVVDVRDGSMTEAGASNPANIIYDILKNVDYGLGKYITDENIDIASLQSFANWCDEVIQFTRWEPSVQQFVTDYEKRYEVNFVIDTKFKAVDLIEKILFSCRAIPYWEGNKFKVVVEELTTEYAQVFTMGNIKKGSFEADYIGYDKTPNQVEIQYLDQDSDYEQTTVVAIDQSRADEYPDSTQINLYGITKQSIAKREAVFQMKKAKATKRYIKFSASIDAIVCQVGDLILFQHDVPQWGYGGRILSVESDKVLLDRYVPLEVGKQFTLRVRLTNGTYFTQTFTATTTGNINSIPCTPPEAIDDSCVWMFGLVGREGKPFRVMSIEKQKPSEFLLTCQEYNESIFDEDENISVDILKYSHLGLTESYDLDGNVSDPVPGTPVYNPNTGRPENEVPPLVQNVTVGEQLALVGNVYRSDIVVTFSPVRMPENSLSRVTKYKIIYSTDSGKTWRVDGETGENGYYRMLGVNVGMTYYIHVKPFTNNEITNYPELGTDKLANEVQVVGKTSAPLAPSNLTISGEVFQLNLRWINPGEPLDYVEVWCATENVRASAVKVASVKGDRFNHGGLAQGVTYYYWLRAYDTSGNASAWYPASDTGGIGGSPSDNPEALVSLLTGSISESMLATELQEKINGSDVSSEVTLLKNQWTLKIQENGYVAGMGLALYQNWSATESYVASDYVWGVDSQVYKCKLANTNQQPPNATYWDLVPYGVKSEMIILADKFAIVQPDGQGGLKAPFIVGSVNGVSTVGIDGSMVIDGTLTASKIQAGSLTIGAFDAETQGAIQAQIDVAGWQSPNDASKINMAAIDGRTVLQVVEGGAVQVGNGNIILDSSDNGSTQGRIIVAPNGGITGHDYVQIDNGNVIQQVYDPTTDAHYQYKSLNRIEFGQALADGVTPVNVPGYWKSPPVIMVSPSVVPMYDKTAPGQDQELKCLPGNIALQSGQTKRYKFTPSVSLGYTSGSLFRDLAEDYEVDPENYDDFYQETLPVTVFTANRTVASSTNLRQITLDFMAYDGSAFNDIMSLAPLYLRPTIQGLVGGSWVDLGTGVTKFIDSNEGNSGPSWSQRWVITSSIAAGDITMWRISWYCSAPGYSKMAFSDRMISITEFYSAGVLQASGIVNWIAVGE